MPNTHAMSDTSQEIYQIALSEMDIQDILDMMKSDFPFRTFENKLRAVLPPELQAMDQAQLKKLLIERMVANQKTMLTDRINDWFAGTSDIDEKMVQKICASLEPNKDRRDQLMNSFTAVMNNGNLSFQAFVDKLREALPNNTQGKDQNELKTWLFDQIIAHLSTLSTNSIRKTVTNWFEGKSVMRKEAVLEMCLNLYLDPDKADQLLTSVTGEMLHLRDPEDIAFLFCLQQKKDYPYYLKLKKKAQEISAQSAQGAVDRKNWLRWIDDFSKGTVHWDKLSLEQTALLLLGHNASEGEQNALFRLSAKSLEGKKKDFLHLPDEERWRRFGQLNQSWFTKLYRSAYDDPDSEEKLLQYLKSNRDYLGHFHHTAYMEFRRMLNQLQRPQDMIQTENNTMSVLDVLKDYLLSKSIQRFNEKIGANDRLMESITKLWPTDAAEIARIKNQEQDVSRKILILLRLATDDYYYSGLEDKKAQMEELGEELNLEDQFEMCFTHTNRFLNDCGFQDLDPRSPFDWLILRSLYSKLKEDEEGSLDDWNDEPFLMSFLNLAAPPENGNEIQN